MKKSRFSEHQIIGILKQAEAGMKVADVCREHGIRVRDLRFSPATYYKWKAQYGGLEVSEVAKLRGLEEENRRLKQMYAQLSLEHQILKEVVEKKL